MISFHKIILGFNISYWPQTERDIWHLILVIDPKLLWVLWSPPWAGWPLWNICVTNDGYVPLVVNTSRFFPHSWLITEFATRLTRRVPLGTAYPSGAPTVFGGVRVTRSLVVCVCFVDHCSFGHCVVWLHLWYLQALLSQRTSSI